MKLLLTSSGLTNKTIIAALRDLLGKPFGEARVVFVPTAANAERGDKEWLVKDYRITYELGWREFDIIDVAVVANLPEALWLPAIQQADALIVGGGNSFYLSYWLEKSGLTKHIPQLLEKGQVYVGVSAGSMVAGKDLRIDSTNNPNKLKISEYAQIGPQGQSSAAALHLTDFVLRPHYNSPHFPKINDSSLSHITTTLSMPMYALDDNSAIKINGNNVQVVSEGEWKLYN